MIRWAFSVVCSEDTRPVHLIVPHYFPLDIELLLEALALHPVNALALLHPAVDAGALERERLVEELGLGSGSRLDGSDAADVGLVGERLADALARVVGLAAREGAVLEGRGGGGGRRLLAECAGGAGEVDVGLVGDERRDTIIIIIIIVMMYYGSADQGFWIILHSLCNLLSINMISYDFTI